MKTLKDLSKLSVLILCAGCAGPMGPPLGLGPGWDEIAGIAVVAIVVALAYPIRNPALWFLLGGRCHPATGPLTDSSADGGEKDARMALFAGAIGSYKNPYRIVM